MSNIKPFIKWAGGKEKELPIILKNLPSNFDRYIEPFVGGGAVYLNINCKNSVINDKSDELMLLYKMIKKGDKDFIKSLNDINKNWIALENIVVNSSKELLDLYNLYKKDTTKLEKLVDSSLMSKDSQDILNAANDKYAAVSAAKLSSDVNQGLISSLTSLKDATKDCDFKIKAENNKGPNIDYNSDIPNSIRHEIRERYNEDNWT